MIGSRVSVRGISSLTPDELDAAEALAFVVP